MIGPTPEQLFRTNVAWAKTMLAADRPRLDTWLEFFEEWGEPDPEQPDAQETAAWELLGLHEDRTPLMNAAFRRWQAGEPNEFFDRLTQPIDLSTTIDITGLRGEELMQALFGPREGEAGE